MQAQTQIFQVAKSKDNDQKEDEIDLFLGVVSPLQDPFNLFLRVTDIGRSDLVYFYSYSLGSNKTIIWGVWERETENFLIDSSCQFDLQVLGDALKKWKDNGYEFFSSQMRDRIQRSISYNLIFKNHKKATILYQNFKIMYLYNKFKNVKELPSDLKAAFLKLDNSDIDIEYELERVKRKIFKLSQCIFVSEKNIGSDFLTDRMKLMRDIEKYFPSSMSKVDIEYVRNIHIFILIMMDVEDYKSIKYMVALNKGDVGEYENDVHKYVDFSFMNSWIDKLVEIINPFDSVEMKDDIFRDMIDIFENSMNMVNVGVIGGPKISRDIANEVNYISQLWRKYLETSEYSKRMLMKKIKKCFLPAECSKNPNVEECQLYRHGKEVSSRWDFS